MLQQAADVIQSRLAQQAVAFRIVKEVGVALPQALVHVHAGAVIAEDRLGHERRHLAVLPRHVADDVLVIHHVVRHLLQGREAHVDLALAGGSYLVMMHFHRDADFLHLQNDLGAQILELIGRRHREVALFVPQLVAEVGLFVPPGVPDAFIRSRCDSSR